ncbi:MAG TPA: hypothetical protein VGE98_14060 [Thermoanaerobaculia bacterium]
MNARKLTAMAILAAGLSAGRAFAASDLWLHVRVVDHEDGGRVAVSLPLAAVDAAASWFPDDDHGRSSLRVGDRDVDVVHLRALWRNLQTRRDATYVTVDDSNGRVRVAKVGDALVFKVDDPEGRHGRGDHVEMRIPGRVVDALLSGRGDRLNFQAGLHALAAAGHGELAVATSDGGTVRMWVDGESE